MLVEYGIEGSMSKPGCLYDNASMASIGKNEAFYAVTSVILCLEYTIFKIFNRLCIIIFLFIW